jgi:Thioredoxin like C-terminal domain/AhpC/TSA family
VSLFNRARSPATASLGHEGRLPGFDGASGWLNSPPLTPADLSGKVVLANFCTYTCINWLRQLPYIRAWGDKYGKDGLVVIGVHTPEFSFEGDIDNVHEALAAMDVEYPIAVDSDYAIWDAFANHYWPALYLADADGTLRYHHFGEGLYEESERAIQALLEVDDELVSVAGSGLEAPADWDSLESPETYLGSGRAERFASPGGAVANERQAYAVPEALRINEWALAGEWTIRREDVISDQAGGSLAYRFHARDLHLVLAPEQQGDRVRFQVLIDGEPPRTARGSDADEDGNGVVSEPRLYQLVRQSGPITDRTFEITFLDPGIRAVVFTFG